MKVIHVLKGKANPDTMNGVNKVVHQLATEQIQQGIDVEVWGLTNTPDVVKHKHDYPLKLFTIPKNRFKVTQHFKNEMSKVSDSAIAHLHSVFLPELYAVTKVLKNQGIEYVLSPHGGYNTHSLKKNYFAKKVYYALFDKKVVQGAKRLQAIGESEVHDLMRISKKKDVVLIPNGYPESLMEQPTIIKDKTNKVIFCYCGRLTKEHKGLDLLVEGFHLYIKQGGTGYLYLIGDGPDRTFLQHFIKKNKLDGSVKLWGTMFGDEKLNLIKKCDAFIHTSRWDGIPTGCIEAAALGLPLLVSRETNLGSYVDQFNSGLTLHENTKLNIAHSLGYFDHLDTAELNRLKNNSIAMVRKEFNWSNISKKLFLNLYS